MNTSNIPDNKILENSTELYMYVSAVNKNKMEIKRMNYKMLINGFIFAGVSIILSFIGILILSHKDIDTAPAWEVLKIYFYVLGIGLVGIIGLSKGASE